MHYIIDNIFVANRSVGAFKTGLAYKISYIKVDPKNNKVSYTFSSIDNNFTSDFKTSQEADKFIAAISNNADILKAINTPSQSLD